MGFWVTKNEKSKQFLLVLLLVTAFIPFASWGQKIEIIEAPTSDRDYSDDSWMSGDLIGFTGEGQIKIYDRVVSPEDPLVPYSVYKVARTNEKIASQRSLQIVVHKSMKEKGYQFVSVYKDGELAFEAPASTAWQRLAPAKVGGSYNARTPPGYFVPDSLEPKRFSTKWQVNLLYVIRFNSGIWLHATTKEHFMELGAPASGGCVRLHPIDAKVIFEMVKREGLSNTAIAVLPEDSDEPQVPWKNQKGRTPPEDMLQWRVTHKIVK